MYIFHINAFNLFKFSKKYFLTVMSVIFWAQLLVNASKSMRRKFNQFFLKIGSTFNAYTDQSFLARGS